MTEDPETTCPRCGAATPAENRFCGSCGAAVSEPAVAVARHDRLTDSSAERLRLLLVEATQGDYEILEELGRGGMAVVYRAHEVHLGRQVAIKVLPPDLTYARGATERFQREARTAAALDHPCIIPIFRISAGGKLFWYAMKFLEGRSLADILLEKGLLTMAEAIAILDQVADALDYAHQRGVVHRDVKPGNVMLDVNGRVTVTDFGIAKELQGSALTGSGAILGTPYYMSPEQCRGGGDITGATDQYSLGVMAYQMISGHLPFEADSAIDVIHKHVSEQPPPLEALLPGLPRNVINAIDRAMSKKAEDRFPTVRAFVNALKNVPAEETLRLEHRSPIRLAHSAPAAQAATRWPARLAAGIIVVAAIGAGALWYGERLRAHQSPEPAPVSQPATSATPPAPAVPDSTVPSAIGTPAERNQVPETTAQGQAPPATTPAAAAPSAAATGMGFVRISIANSYATFSIAGHDIEQRRGYADSVPAGTYTVIFKRAGWADAQRTVTVRPGRETAIRVRMQPLSTP